jgi:hypothetical protein
MQAKSNEPIDPTPSFRTGGTDAPLLTCRSSLLYGYLSSKHTDSSAFVAPRGTTAVQFVSQLERGQADTRSSELSHSKRLDAI